MVAEVCLILFLKNRALSVCGSDGENMDDMHETVPDLEEGALSCVDNLMFL